jgi:hypothetical protein
MDEATKFLFSQIEDEMDIKEFKPNNHPRITMNIPFNHPRRKMKNIESASKDNDEYLNERTLE